MGRYTDGLYGRKRKQAVRRSLLEYIAQVAIRRGDKLHYVTGCKSHYELRRMLGDSNPIKPLAGDVELFITSKERVIDRLEASQVATTAGQSRTAGRALLSSDILWWS